ncbi:hypothetical protein ACLOJK_037675 [Asimina triloba]
MINCCPSILLLGRHCCHDRFVSDRIGFAAASITVYLTDTIDYFSQLAVIIAVDGLCDCHDGSVMARSLDGNGETAGFDSVRRWPSVDWED